MAPDLESELFTGLRPLGRRRRFGFRYDRFRFRGRFDQFGCHFGGRFETLFGLAGVGDILTTCYSHFGRNHRVGEMIGQGLPPSTLLENLPYVAEGVFTTRSVNALARQEGVAMPITSEVHQVLFEGKDPREAVADLMLRPPRGEWL